MINKLMIGRLGNQMFQYATVRAYQEKYCKEEKINLNFDLVYREGKIEDGFYNQLKSFNIKKCYVDKKINISFKQKAILGCYFLKYKIIKLFSKNTSQYELKKRQIELKMQHIFQNNGLFICSFGYCDFKKTEENEKLFLGFYESSKYFDNIKPLLKLEFTPKYPEKDENGEMYKIIRNSESICVSIRRGDFLSAEQKNRHYVCTPEYFKNAIKKMQELINNPQFIIFSDDIEWVKKNITFPEGTVFESGNDPVWEKLRLMYECKHFIISNSTFSWWAQYLSRNENNKIVISPKIWKNEGYNEDIFQENWIRI